LLSTDHKRVALLYLASITGFFFIAGGAAALMRIELLTRPATYSQGDLQPPVHHARHNHGLVLSDPSIPPPSATSSFR